MPSDQQQQARRRAAIERLLRRKKPVRTQADLVEALERLGHAATQSSVSRDLREMGIRKDDGGYVLPEPEPAPAATRQTIGSFVRSVTPAGANLVVVRTAVGAAQRVAVELDRSGWPEITGTISGDDTIFIATTGAAVSRRLMTRLQQQFAGAPA
jgi:transcriptional regulator of arginine metabolism